MNTKYSVALLSLTLCSASSARAETLEWIRQLGTSEGVASYGVSADGLGSVYITGDTDGNLEGTIDGETDGFLSKYDASGTLQWTRQYGSSGWDVPRGVSADGLGNVYITGSTGGSLEGTNAGGRDVFLSKYNASGTFEWTRQFGTSESDGSYGVSADGLGGVYISGWTKGSLGEPNAGRGDAFVVKFTDLPDLLLGDVNLDGEVNGLDVDPFVEVLLSGPHQQEADMNDDQVVNGLDVDPFVAAVVGGGVQQIPEPSTLLLCLLALAVVGGCRKWGNVA